MHYIYKITNVLNNKIYIGQSNKETERWRQHKYFARQDNPIQYIHRAMKKYGIDNFTYEVIDFAFNQWQADCLELNYIQQFDSRNKMSGYNIAHGGNVTWQSGLPPEAYPMYGKHHTEESKRKSSISNTGKKKPHTEAWRKQMSDILTGHIVTEETKHKISVAQRGDKRPNAILTWEIVRSMRKDYDNGMRQRDIMTKYNLSSSRVNRIIKKQQWIE